MTRPSRRELSLLLSFSALPALALLPAPPRAAAQDLPFLEHSRVDPRKVETAEACGECHISEYDVWKETPHAEGFKSLHRKSQAETIAKKMGFRLIKRDSLCFSCHYTPIVEGGKIRVVSGVSCESCHGAGADWIEIHNNYGPGKTHGSETAEHRRQRVERSRSAGMRRPSDLYPVVANCFSCHTVPNEKLVNVGGHTTGSSGFEFVEWAQGEIRHNFLAPLRAGTFGANAERPAARKRLMFVVGRALDLEYSLRGVAVATDDGVYAKAMIRRVRSALAELRAIAGVASLPQVDEMLAAARSARVVPRNKAELLAAADEVGAATRRLLAANETLQVADLDRVMLGLPDEEEPFDPGVAVASDPGAPAPGGLPAASTPATEGSSTPTGTGAARTPGGSSTRTATAGGTAASGTGIVGEFKRRVRPASSHRTLGPGACSGCHGPQNEWWFKDAHYRSADPFFDGAPENQRIARLYGVSQVEMTRGRNVCMDCHGTIISGKESREVLDGVSCESCHGAAADWLEPHKNEANKSLGQQRPGHLAALAKGKLKLRDQAVRARACAGCHYIVERRLLSAGHPSGADFDYAGGMAKVRHWSSGPVPTAQLASALAAERSSRGPVPDVPRAQLASVPRSPAASGSAGRSSASGGNRSTSTGGATGTSVLADPRSAGVAALRPPRPRPVALAASGTSSALAAPVGSAAAVAVELPPFPEIEEGAPIEEVLLLLRDRLKLLYRVVGAGDAAGANE